MESLRLVQRRVLQQLIQTRSQTLRQLQQTSQQPFRTRPGYTTAFKRGFHSQQPSSSPFSNAFRNQSHNFRRHNSSASSATSSESLSLSQRLKKLSREYGWSALGVYLLLSAADFPFCLLAVRLLGTDRIGHWEHVIMSYIKGVVKWPLPEAAREQVDDMSEKAKALVLQQSENDEQRLLEVDQAYGVEDHGYKAAEKANTGEDASLWTQLVLAYAIHKSFIFIRVPLTAAVTPKVVKTLRGWGWNIGKMPKRKSVTSGKTGVNTKGSGVKPDD